MPLILISRHPLSALFETCQTLMNPSYHCNLRILTDPVVADKVTNAISITGIARSGTTIMGQLIHSLKDVEYGFEPTLLMRLFLLLDQMPEDAWRVLYQTCLYDGILSDAIAGRNLNFNSHDDSYIFGAKSLSDVAARFCGENRYKELFKKVGKIQIAYKLPDIIAMLPTLKERYPETRMLVMLRSPDAVVLSLKRKAWFRRAVPQYCESGLLKEVDGHTVPAIVSSSDVPAWIGLGETDRCYLFYHQVYRELHRSPGAVVVDFDRFVDAPKKIFGEVLDRFGLEYGEKTESILAEIAAPHPDYPVPQEADGLLRDQAWELYHRCRESAV